MTDFRALCEELLRSLENYPVQPLRDRDLCIRARAALAEQPVGPTDEELRELYDEMRGEPGGGRSYWAFLLDFARAVLARWGQS
jgi:hypothetical protein